MKIWHDDIRRPPDDTWDVWTRTNKDALRELRTGRVEEISLDHDMGLHEADPDDLEPIFTAGADEDNGYELVKVMCREGLVPDKVTIHSWNPSGAKRMALLLNDHGHDCVVAPWQLPADRLKSGSKNGET